MHFVYVPIAIINSLFLGEDINAIGLIIFITSIIGAFAFGFNYSITYIGLKLFKTNVILAFLLPTITQLILYIPISRSLQYLDFGGDYIYILFVIISMVVNIGVYIILKPKS